MDTFGLEDLFKEPVRKRSPVDTSSYKRQATGSIVARSRYTAMSTSTAIVRRGRGAHAKVLPESIVVNEDRMPPAAANDVFIKLADRFGASSDEARDELLDALAIALSKGTSYVRKYHSVTISVGGREQSLSALVELLPNRVENIVRVWARSLPGFADRTTDLIGSNDWLRSSVSMANQVSHDMAHVCFDYADAITYALTPTERQTIAANVSRKVGGSRQDFFENDAAGESNIVPGAGKNAPALPAPQMTTPSTAKRNAGGVYGI